MRYVRPLRGTTVMVRFITARRMVTGLRPSCSAASSTVSMSGGTGIPSSLRAGASEEFLTRSPVLALGEGILQRGHPARAGGRCRGLDMGLRPIAFQLPAAPVLVLDGRG